MTKDVELHKNNQIVKANKLIEAKGRLSLLEQKLFASLVSEITPEDKDFKTYHLDIKELAEFIESDSNTIYEDLKKVAKNLTNKQIFIEEYNENGVESFFATNLISSARHSKGDSYIKIAIDPNLKPYLLAINGEETPFTKYMLKNILKLSSSYSIRLYELLKQYLNIRSRKFKMDELREFLSIEDKYKRFTNFENRILKVAKKEINEHTDIDIDYKKIKKGRSITHIEFSIQPNTVDEKAEVLERLYDKDDYDQLVSNMNLTDKKLNRKQIFELYEIACNKTDHINNLNVYDYVKINADYTNKQNPTNYFAYLKKALQDDFSGAISILKLLGNRGDEKWMNYIKKNY